jgi:hypothetical protein
VVTSATGLDRDEAALPEHLLVRLSYRGCGSALVYFVFHLLHRGKRNLMLARELVHG